MRPEFYYIATIQYLGFRLHGWQKQKLTHKTVEGMLERTLIFVLEEQKIKTLGASRTDAMVSAVKSVCKITLEKDTDPKWLMDELNKNLPQDIKVLDLKRSTKEFQVISDTKVKEYHYYFCSELKAHPFSAPYMTNFQEKLDINKMKEAAKLFEGHHNFSRYCFRPTPTKVYERTIDFCEVQENTDFTASFFPENSYVLKVHGKGFLRNQVRLMMGALVMVGNGELSLEQIKESLIGEEFKLVSFIAPASGLMLKDIGFQ